LFLTFNVNLGFFEARLLGPVRAAGAAVTVVGDSSVFAPDARNVRSAGHGYALGLAVMSGAFHPKLTVLAGPQRALIGIGSGNLTISGWHANDEMLTTIRASQEHGVPTIVGELVTFLRNLPARVQISPLAVEGITRTADQLAALIDAAEEMDTGHRLVDSLRGTILSQLPAEAADELELSAPFHDLPGAALAALVERYHPTRVTVLAQPGQAVMNPTALKAVAQAGGSELRFLQLEGEESTPRRYRHGKVLTAIWDHRPTWSVVGSPNLSGDALLKQAPAGNCELAVISAADRSLLPNPTFPVTNVSGLLNKIGAGPDSDDAPTETGKFRLLEARAVEGGVEVLFASEATTDIVVEVSPFMASPDEFDELGVVRAGEKSVTFAGLFSAGTRIRVGDQLQFLAFAEQVVNRLSPTGMQRPNHDSTAQELFASDAVAAQWHSALTRLLLAHGGQRVGSAAPTGSGATPGVANWRTLDDDDSWSAYSDDALARLGMPIFELAVGASTTARSVGTALPNASPAWEDRFEETSEAFEEGTTAETADQPNADAEAGADTSSLLSPYQRSRRRKWLSDLVELVPQLGPLERITITQLAVLGSSALIWDGPVGPAGWFDPLAAALEGMARDDWPAAAARQAEAVATIGLYRLKMAIPADERGFEATRFLQIGQKLAPLVKDIDPDFVANNLSLLVGTTFISRSADDVIAEVKDAISAGPDRVLLRILERLVPGVNAEWIAERKLVLSGSMSNPSRTAADVLSHATAFPEIAIGVNSDRGPWTVVARVGDRITVVEGGKRSNTYKTYDTSRLLNPLAVFTEPELARSARISEPPWGTPGDVDLAVLAELGIGTGPLS
jgi:hypothetical protein